MLSTELDQKLDPRVKRTRQLLEQAFLSQMFPQWWVNYITKTMAGEMQVTECFMPE